MTAPVAAPPPSAPATAAPRRPGFGGAFGDEGGGDDGFDDDDDGGDDGFVDDGFVDDWTRFCFCLKQFPAYLNRWDSQQARNEGVFAH
jgi:hypothetical protein